MVATSRLNKDASPLRLHLTKRRSRRRQLGPATALAAIALASLTACGGDLLGRNRSVGYLGGVVADEPHAALVGREVLVGGGTAGDAAVATYFALSATLPSTAGLGGGGVCVAYDPDRKRMETIEFLPRPTKGGGMAVPANVRGMALLHARFGRLPWTQLLAPAEQLARIGTEVSRAFANDLSQPELIDHADLAVREAYTDLAGRPVREGTQLRQADLAAILSRVRTLGAGDFYSGQAAHQIVEAVHRAGGDLTLDDLRGYLPHVVAPLKQPLGNHLLLLPPPPAAGSAVAADLYAMATAAGYAGAPQAQRVHIMAAAVRRALAAEAQRLAGQGGDVGTPSRAKMMMADYRSDGAGPPISIDLPADAAPPATSFVVLDNRREAIACTVTLGGWFGGGRIATGTGMAIAAPPSRAGVLSMTPLLVVNTNTERAFMALGSADTRYAAAAAIETLLGTFIEHRTLADILARPRLADDGQSVLLEPEADDTAQALEQVGYHLTEMPRIGRVNAVYCPTDLPTESTACEAHPDPRGFGLAANMR
jgi:gamma-glutamyltranspeptidase/glutathione hydrolase